MSVTILATNSGETDPGQTPPAGSNRVAYIGLGTDDVDDGLYNATACTYGGQSCTLIGGAQVSREGTGMTVFRLLSSGIAAMSGNAIVPTWGDTNGTPDNPRYFVLIVAGVDQGNANGTVQTFTDDTSITTWNPGSLTQVDDGLGVGFLSRGASNTISFDAPWTTPETVIPGDGAGGALGYNEYTSAGTDSINLTFGSVARPHVLVAFVVNPSLTSSNIDIAVPTGPWR